MQRSCFYTIDYGTKQIAYAVCFSRRKILAIQVYPDQRVNVRAPHGSSLETIATIVGKRAGWIVKQQQRFASYAPPTVLPREYVSGESYGYLGRQYRLNVLNGTPEPVTLGQSDLLSPCASKSRSACNACSNAGIAPRRSASLPNVSTFVLDALPILACHIQHSASGA